MSEEFEVGDRVFHPVYGWGKVIECREHTVDVEYPDKLAPLNIHPEDLYRSIEEWATWEANFKYKRDIPVSFDGVDLLNTSELENLILIVTRRIEDISKKALIHYESALHKAKERFGD